MFYIWYIGALLYDGIMLVALFFFFTALCLLCRDGKAIPSASLWYQLALLLLIFGYYFISYQRGGQTIGMRAWHLKLVSVDPFLSKKQILTRLFLTVPACVYGLLQLKNPAQLLRDWTQSYMIRN